MPEDEYEAQLAKEAMAEFNAKADKLQATERELVMQSRQDEVRRREWVARYDVALEKQPPDEREIAASMAAVKELRNEPYSVRPHWTLSKPIMTNCLDSGPPPHQ
jgi:hypothetical protein